MAGEATIGALRVILGADTAKFEDNLKSALGSLDSFGKKALAIATGIQLSNIFEQAFHGVVESITSAIDAADKLSKASQKFGIPVETLAALSNAAELSDVSLEQLSGSLAKLSKNMLAAGNITSEQASAFKALGLSVPDLRMKSLDEVVLTLADSFSKFRDGAAKTAVAQAVLGRGGQDLIPLFNQGSDAVRKMLNSLNDLDPQFAENAATAEKYKDSLKELEQAKNTIVLRILGSSGMLAAMQQLSASFVNASHDTQLLTDIGNALGVTLRFLTPLAQALAAAFDAASLPARAFAAALFELSQGNFAAAGKAISDRFIETKTRIEGAFTALKDFDSAAIDFTYTGLSDELQKTVLAGLKLRDLKFDPEFDKQLTKFNEQLGRIQAHALDVSGAFAGQLAPGFLAAASGMEILKGQVTLTADAFARLGPLAKQLNDQMLALEGAKLTQDFLTPWQQYEQTLARNQLLLQNLKIGLDTFTLSNQEAALKMDIAYATVFNNIAQNGANAFKDLASVSHEFAGAAKAAAIAQATIATYLGAANAYAQAALIGGPVFASVAAAVAVAAGLANVAKIIATPFAKGGSFMVPGGINSRDNMMVPLALSGGERVDVTPSSTVRDRGGRPREVVLSGLGPRDFFTGDMLRGLVDALNQGERDGYRLKFAER